MRLIDADELKTAFPASENSTPVLIASVRATINHMPTIELERMRGKWIEDDDGWDEVIWRCSECDAVFTLIDGTPKENEYYFCPHCGADMREDEQE